MKYLIALLLLVASVGAATFPSDGSNTNVQTLINGAASNGDIVTIPAGTYTWTGGIVIDAKGVTIQGAGVGSTTIREALTGTPSFLISISPGASQTSRVTGIAFVDGGGAGTFNIGMIGVACSNTNGSRVRIDHCSSTDVNGFHVYWSNGLGSIDNNAFNMSTGVIPIYSFQKTWNGSENGDGSWAAGDLWGTVNFLFVETNTITFTGVRYAATDGFGGDRMVFRYNTVHNGYVEKHGTESGQIRGARAIEVYNNTFTGDEVGEQSIVHIRSGTSLVYNNTATGTGYIGNKATRLSNYALVNAFIGYGPGGSAQGADGTRLFDNNEPTVYESGTATDGGGLTMTDSSKTWTTNQWAGYTLRNLEASVGTETFSLIQSNTATVITFAPGVGGAFPNMVFAAGKDYQIRKVITVLDQTGIGQGDLLSGYPPLPAAWPNQAVDPCYAWGNSIGGVTGAGANQILSDAPSQVIENVHYFQNTQLVYTPFTYPYPWGSVPGGGGIIVQGTTTVTGTITLP